MRPASLRAALFAGTALLVLSGCGDKGPPIDEAGARKIENGIQQGLDLYLYDRPGMDVTVEGAPKAVPAGDHYDVTFPGLSIRLGDQDPETAGEDGSTGTVAKVGSTTARVVPLKDGTYRYEGKLPDTLQIVGADDEQIAFKIGSSRVAGVWLPQYDTSVDYELKAEKLSLDAKDLEIDNFGIDLIESKQTSTKKGEGINAVDAILSMKGLSIAGNGDTVKLDGLSFASALKDLDLPKYMAVLREFQTMSKAMAGKVETPAAQHEILAKVGQLFQTMGAISGTLTGTGLSIQSDDGDKVALAEFTYGSDYSGGAAELGRAGTSFSFRGLSIDPAPEMAWAIPQSMEIRLRADKIPAAAMGKALLDVVGAAPAGTDEDEASEAQQMAAMAAMAAVTEAAGKAGTTLTADAITVTLPAAAASLTGSATVVPTAAKGVTADYTLVLTDLDKAVKALSAPSGGAIDPQQMQAAMMLGMVQTLATPGKGSDGRPTHTLRLLVKEDGSILVNDKDIAQIMQAMQGQN
ncbi:hypothetical protein [Oleisolibacter albus]|uniref:hypothetical protein n=1 Tax=Oleisolibacter albus TaxID=2171757 RepID=UPI000DF2ADA9|nr:hypothetical protein [Oleisolibacter albus]